MVINVDIKAKPSKPSEPSGGGALAVPKSQPEHWLDLLTHSPDYPKYDPNYRPRTIYNDIVHAGNKLGEWASMKPAERPKERPLGRLEGAISYDENSKQDTIPDFSPDEIITDQPWYRIFTPSPKPPFDQGMPHPAQQPGSHYDPVVISQKQKDETNANFRPGIPWKNDDRIPHPNILDNPNSAYALFISSKKRPKKARYKFRKKRYAKHRTPRSQTWIFGY